MSVVLAGHATLCTYVQFYNSDRGSVDCIALARASNNLGFCSMSLTRVDHYLVVDSRGLREVIPSENRQCSGVFRYALSVIMMRTY